MDPFALITKGDLATLKQALADDPRAASAANKDGASLLSFAHYMGNANAATAIRDVLPELTPHEACIAGDTATVEAALASGWDANALAPDGFTPLALACFFSRTELVDLLLPRTRDVNARAQNGQQVAAIHAAAAVRDAATVEKLLRAGADPNLPQQQDFRPLHTAARQDDAVIAGLLLLSGADPALANDAGETPADVARKAGHDWLAERLGAR